MLQKIAEADYETDVELHLSALQPIRDERRVPAPLEWHPGEVLELIRWSEPENPNWEPGETGRIGHVMRAFSCAVLLRASAEKGNEELRQGENHTLVQLLVSVDMLGPEFQEAARRFLAWRIDQHKIAVTDRPFFLLGVLLLGLKCRPELATDDINDVVQSLIRAERTARITEVIPKENSEWLLGITHFDLKHDVWRAMGQQLMDLSGSIADRKTRASVVDIANRLQGSAQS